MELVVEEMVEIIIQTLHLVQLILVAVVVEEFLLHLLMLVELVVQV